MFHQSTKELLAIPSTRHLGLHIDPKIYRRDARRWRQRLDFVWRSMPVPTMTRQTGYVPPLTWSTSLSNRISLILIHFIARIKIARSLDDSPKKQKQISGGILIHIRQIDHAWDTLSDETCRQQTNANKSQQRAKWLQITVINQVRICCPAVGVLRWVIHTPQQMLIFAGGSTNRS